jgi:hypothetical protein
MPEHQRSRRAALRPIPRPRNRSRRLGSQPTRRWSKYRPRDSSVVTDAAPIVLGSPRCRTRAITRFTGHGWPPSSTPKRHRLRVRHPRSSPHRTPPVCQPPNQVRSCRRHLCRLLSLHRRRSTSNPRRLPRRLERPRQAIDCNSNHQAVSRRHRNRHRPVSRRHRNRHRPVSRRHRNRHRPVSRRHRNRHRPVPHSHRNRHRPVPHSHHNRHWPVPRNNPNKHRPVPRGHHNQHRAARHLHQRQCRPAYHRCHPQYWTVVPRENRSPLNRRTEKRPLLAVCRRLGTTPSRRRHQPTNHSRRHGHRRACPPDWPCPHRHRRTPFRSQFRQRHRHETRRPPPLQTVGLLRYALLLLHVPDDQWCRFLSSRARLRSTLARNSDRPHRRRSLCR